MRSSILRRIHSRAPWRRYERRKMSTYAFLFPGQGSQVVGMTKKLCDIPSVVDIFATAERVLGYDLKTLCLRGPQDVLDQTVHCQPAVVVASLAALEALKKSQPQMYSSCCAAAGFSVGEFTALIFAGALSLEQGLSLIKLRSEVMQAACEERPSGMLTLIGLDQPQVEQLCLKCRGELPDSEITIANYLFPKGFVLSGAQEAITLVREMAVETDLGATVKNVAVSGAFHSNLMLSAVPKLQKGVESADISLPRLPVYSNVTGLPYSSVDEIRTRLAEQIVRPVLWEGTVRNMMERERGGGEELNFVEIGPGRQLKAMLKRIDKDAFKKCTNFESSS